MTHDELLAKLNPVVTVANITKQYNALRAVVELHKPYKSEAYGLLCSGCPTPHYPCQTIEAIEDMLHG